MQAVRDRLKAALQHSAVIRTSRRTVRKTRISGNLAVQPMGLVRRFLRVLPSRFGEGYTANKSFDG